MSENTNNDRDVRPPNARLCHVIKSDTFDGYGFNLHANKGSPGQYIGKVDPGSPAEVAGLREGDRILEVNGSSIRNENHKQVVQRIKALSGETKLLVVEPEPETEKKVNNSDSNANSNSNANQAQGNGHSAHLDDNSASAVMQPQSQTTVDNNAPAAGLNLSMTAAELRAKLAAKKKFDPRKESIDFKKKFDVVQKL